MMSKPILTSVISNGVWIPAIETQFPIGINEMDVIAKITAIIGAAM